MSLVKLFLSKKILILTLIGIVFAFLPVGAVRAEHICQTEYDTAVAEGNLEIYFFDLIGYNPVMGWLRTDVSIDLSYSGFNLSEEDYCPGVLDPSGRWRTYKMISSFKMANGAEEMYDVELKDQDGDTICFTESVKDLRSAGDEEWNDRAVSLKVLVSGECAEQGITQGADSALKDLCGHCSITNPICHASCIVQYLLSLPIRIPLFMLALVIGAIGLAVGLLSFVIQALMNWIVVATMSIGVAPYATGGAITPDIVAIGWEFCRDMVNMFFILILVFIGLSTILKLREYEVKKTLPKLILIVLLINFTPIIVGFVVDIANLATNFFLQQVQKLNWSDMAPWNNAWNYFSKDALSIWTADGQFFTEFSRVMGEILGVIVYGLVLLVFYAFSALIYLLIALVFFLRTIWLWILMILAPIAFFSFVVPATKEAKRFFPGILHWDEWWEKLIQWSIVGIPLGFFLYLSGWVMANTGSMETTFQSGMAETAVSHTATGMAGTVIAGAGLSGLITSLLGPTIGIALLYIGFLISIEAAPAGAKMILGAGKNLASGAALMAGKKAAITLGTGTAGTIAGGWKGLKEGKGIRGRLRGGAAGIVKGGFTPTGHEEGAKWYKKGLEKFRLAAPGAYEESMKREKSTEMGRMKEMSPQGLDEVVSRTALTRKSKTTRAAALELLAERKALKDDYKNKGWIEESKTFGVDISKIEKARPDWSADPREKTEKMSVEDFVNKVQSDALESLEVFYAMGSAKAKRLEARGSRDQKTKLRDLIIRNQAVIQNEIDRLRGIGKTEEADRISDVGNYINTEYTA